MGKSVVYKMEDLEEPPFKARAYRRGGFISTVETDDVLYKHARSFKTVERAERTLEAWKGQGWSGAPSSPATCFARCLEEKVSEGEVMHPKRATPRGMELSGPDPCWLWIERMCPSGYVASHVYHYDINEAFWSATRQGLPAHFAPYQDGDERWVGVVELRDSTEDLPYFWERRDRAVLTATDVRYYDLDVEILDALSFEDFSVDLSPVVDRVSELFGPWVSKRARQQCWGTFAMDGGVEGIQYDEDGHPEKTWTIQNRWQCKPWSVIITRRIMRSVHRALSEGDGVSCFVDSILARRPIATGETPGEWRKESEFPRGIRIVTPGIYDSLPNDDRHVTSSWYRHAGISTSGTGKHRPDVDPGTHIGQQDADRGKGFEVPVQWKADYQEYKNQYGGPEEMAVQIEAPPEDDQRDDWRDEVPF